MKNWYRIEFYDDDPLSDRMRIQEHFAIQHRLFLLSVNILVLIGLKQQPKNAAAKQELCRLYHH